METYSIFTLEVNYQFYNSNVTKIIKILCNAFVKYRLKKVKVDDKVFYLIEINDGNYWYQFENLQFSDVNEAIKIFNKIKDVVVGVALQMRIINSKDYEILDKI